MRHRDPHHRHTRQSQNDSWPFHRILLYCPVPPCVPADSTSPPPAPPLIQPSEMKVGDSLPISDSWLSERRPPGLELSLGGAIGGIDGDADRGPGRSLPRQIEE